MNNMMNIGFVFLHYNNIEVTKKAIRCIDNLHKDQCNIEIVIVDNASINKSGKYLQSLYIERNDIHIILSSVNLGFARGNNLGYKWLIEKGIFDYIIILNTDVFIYDYNFLDKLTNIDRKYQIIGPDIITPKQFHQNPFRLKAITDRQIKGLLLYNSIMARVYSYRILGTLAAFFLERKNDKSKKINIQYKDSDMEDVVLHGSCLIFTRSWIENEIIAFPPITFMYMEEDILFEYVMKKNYHTFFSSELKVQHMEDASVNSSFKANINKRLFLAKNMSISIKKMKEIRENNEK